MSGTRPQHLVERRAPGSTGNIKKIRALPLVLVEWYDAHSEGGWASHASYMRTHRDRLLVTSVGFMLRRDGRSLTLVQSLQPGDGDHFARMADSISIPAGCVRRVRGLTSAKRRR